MKRAGDALFDVVKAVAQFLDLGRGLGIGDFGKFFKGAEGFADAFSRGDHHRCDIHAG